MNVNNWEKTKARKRKQQHKRIHSIIKPDESLESSKNWSVSRFVTSWAGNDHDAQLTLVLDE